MKFVFNKDIFRDNGLMLRYVISQDGVADCWKYESKLGKDLSTNEYRRKRRAID